MFDTNNGNKPNENEEINPSGENNSELAVANQEKQQDGISLLQQTNSITNVTMTENLAQNNSELVKPQNNKMKTFVNNHRKHIAIICCFVLIIGIGVLLYGYFWGFEKLSWNYNYSDSKLTYVTQANIKLGVNFSDDTKINEIKYSATCGKVENNGLELKWDLTEAIGECKIIASYKLKKISKEYQIIPFDMKEEELTLDYKINLDSDEDLDLDNLTNKQEKEYKTNPLLSDSDMDGLDDDYEIKTSKTDPNIKDTDGDGVNDYDEIKLGLDPLKADSNGDGIKDGERSLTYDYETDGLKLSISGKGNIASTIAEINSKTKISSKKGMIDNLYTLYTDGNIDEAVVTISYTNEDLEKYGLNEENLSIFYYNEKEAKYEIVETIVDKENNTLTATLKHFSNYVVGDKLLVKEEETTQILFILDNSWSMYSNAQYKEITGKEYSGGLFGGGGLDGFDEEGVRFTLTSDLVSKLAQKNYQMGLAEFRSDYANAAVIGTDANSIKTTLKGMNGKFITKTEGTNIGNALTKGIEEFPNGSDNKFIVILTDGQDTSLSSKTAQIIEKANSSDVKICSIGFGGGSYNTELANISNGTGCKFFSSSNVNGLTELFENIEAELDDDLVDLDNDGEADGILLADSGFVVNRDGFSFVNYGSNLSVGGHCFGMATFAELYYKKVLPLKVDSLTSKDNKSYNYNLSNTYFKNYSNLYDYKLKTNALKYTFGYDIFDEKVPADFRGLKDDVLIINNKYKEEIENSGIYDIKEEKTGLSKEAQIEKWGVNYNTSENILLNEDKMQNSSSISNDDKQMFNAIYASFIKQKTTTFYSSATNFTLWLRNVVGTEATGYTGAAGFINIIKTRLDDHDPLVISSSYSGGLHAINAISLVQDIENPNYYYIGVYDNNYPGEKRYVDIECKNGICVTKANSYYTDSDQPIRITPSLEYDLAYYTK